MLSTFGASWLAVLVAVVAGCGGDRGSPGGPDAALGAHVVLATGQDHPDALAVDDTSVYWVNRSGGQVRKVPKAGGDIVTLADVGPNLNAIAVDPSRVYVTNDNRAAVLVMPPGGGDAMVLGTSPSPYLLAQDETTIFWTSNTAGMLLSVAKAGGAASTLANHGSYGYGVAVDDAAVYWAHSANAESCIDDPANCCVGQIFRVAKTDGSESLVADHQCSPGQVALDAEYIYWLSIGTSTGPQANTGILRAAKSGGAFEVVVPGPVAGDFAVDQDNVYYFDTSGSLTRMAKRGGATEVLLQQAMTGSTGSLVVDASGIYWTVTGEDTDGSVHAL